MKKIKYGKFEFGDGTFLNYTPCPYNMPGYHGNFAVGSADCQLNCSCFVEINKEKKDFIYIGITLLGKTYIHKDIIKWINDIKLWQIQINPQASASSASLPSHS